MRFGEIGSFLFIPGSLYTPGSTEDPQGLLHILKPQSSFSENCFVVIPYSNPYRTKTIPSFYAIEKTIQVQKSDLDLHAGAKTQLSLKAGTPKEKYLEKIRALKKQIRQGNIYEINYCIEFSAIAEQFDPWEIFFRLNELAKAPYRQLVKLGDDLILCASPELFLEKKGNTLSTKPIKGTIRRGKTPAEDEALKLGLFNNVKERTENVMAVDVARNDLSMIAAKGSVQVNKLYNIETFETVHQMVSTVSCELKEGTDFNKIIDCTFPMASMTGAPKSRAMQLIDETEDFERRFYSGAIGLAIGGDLELSVVIRSVFYNLKSRRLSIAVGGAITHLSDPEQEYEECLLKANALLKALNARITDQDLVDPDLTVS